jgi:hypothetical protein
VKLERVLGQGPVLAPVPGLAQVPVPGQGPVPVQPWLHFGLELMPRVFRKLIETPGQEWTKPKRMELPNVYFSLYSSSYIFMLCVVSRLVMTRLSKKIPISPSFFEISFNSKVILPSDSEAAICDVIIEKVRTNVNGNLRIFLLKYGWW